MSERKINLEEILDKVIDNKYKNVPNEHKTDFQRKLKNGETYLSAIEAMKEACKHVLELASENARTKKIMLRTYIVDKQSITDTINQIE